MPLTRLRSVVLPSLIAFPAIALAATNLWAQAAASASISGQVVDELGDPIPKVAVSVSGSALQVPLVSATTDAQGHYQILHLPAPGTYEATFEHQGFQTHVQEDLNISVGFAARVDVVMKIGPVSQNVKVSGSSPVVDPVNTSVGTTLQSAEIDRIPKGAGLQELLPMAAGVSLQGKPDVGDSNLASRSEVITYGVLLQPTIEIEGINVTTSQDRDTAVYIDSFAVAIPDYRLRPSSQPIIKFHERPDGSPDAIRAWFYPGRTYGHEFVYPKNKAVVLAQVNHTPVPSMPTELAEQAAKPDVKMDGPETAAMDTAPLKAEEPTGEEVELAQAFEVADTHSSMPAAELPEELPRTGSSLPLVGLIGLLSLGTAVATRVAAAKTK